MKKGIQILLLSVFILWSQKMRAQDTLHILASPMLGQGTQVANGFTIGHDWSEARTNPPENRNSIFLYGDVIRIKNYGAWRIGYNRSRFWKKCFISSGLDLVYFRFNYVVREHWYEKEYACQFRSFSIPIRVGEYFKKGSLYYDFFGGFKIEGTYKFISTYGTMTTDRMEKSIGELNLAVVGGVSIGFCADKIWMFKFQPVFCFDLAKSALFEPMVITCSVQISKIRDRNHKSSRRTNEIYYREEVSDTDTKE